MENVLEVAQQESGLKSRRSAMLLGGAALAGLALSNSKPAAAQSTGVTDVDILNFALNLEFLEAQFYAYATTGAAYTGNINSGDGNTKGGTVSIKSNPMVDFSSDPNLQAFAMEVAMDEANHVAFLQSALNASGANASVAMPNIDLMASFNTLAMAAGLGATFDPFASAENFLIGAFIFEDVGVTAYQGAAPLISSTTYLDKALGIHLVEAYHAGAIRQRIFALGSPYTDYSQAIAATRAKLDGSSPADDIGVMVNGTGLTGSSTIVDSPTANASLTTARTTTQVLNIVYGSTAAPPAPGVFFPAGMNGTIK